MEKQAITCDTETGRNIEQINNINPIVPPTQKKTRTIPTRVTNCNVPQKYNKTLFSIIVFIIVIPDKKRRPNNPSRILRIY